MSNLQGPFIQLSDFIHFFQRASIIMIQHSNTENWSVRKMMWWFFKVATIYASDNKDAI